VVGGELAHLLREPRCALLRADSVPKVAGEHVHRGADGLARHRPREIGEHGRRLGDERVATRGEAVHRLRGLIPPAHRRPRGCGGVEQAEHRLAVEVAVVPMRDEPFAPLRARCSRSLPRGDERRGRGIPGAFGLRAALAHHRSALPDCGDPCRVGAR
jgi:hypothetical protein